MRSHIWRTCLLALIAALAIFLVIPVSADPAQGGIICLNEIPLPLDVDIPFSIIHGPDNNVWFFETLDTGNYRIAKMTTSGAVTEFPMVGTPALMASGPDGNIWFTRSDTNVVGRITPLGSVTTFTLPIGSDSPFGIASGPDGNLWITEVSGRQIERITPDGEVTGQFPIPTPNNAPREIAAGADSNLWFIEYAIDYTNNKIGRITTSGVITEFPITTSDMYLTGIAAGPDGNIWFVETPTSCDGTPYPGCSGKVGKITPGGIITEFDVPWTPYNITAGPHGNLWSIIAFRGGYAIARIATDGTVTGFSVPSSKPMSGVLCYFLTSGGDGKIWLTETSSAITPARIAMFDPQAAGSCYFYYFPSVFR
jgi:streptogramin lyase